jgi:putative ABC transport system permease protein
VVALEVFVGIAVPVLGALTPVLRGSRITVREAITDYGVGSGGGAHGWVDRLLESVHFLTRPMLLSLRNTFRRKGRLILTLITLTLASAIFIGVFGVQSSMYRTMDDAFAYWNYDVRVNLGRQYRVDYLEEQALAYPGVTAAEAWGFGGAIRNRPDETESDTFRIIAPQPGSTMLSPTMTEGRWLLPEDQNAIVINTDLLKDEPDLRVGDTIALEIGGRENDWEIVGIARSVLAGPYGYVNYPWFSRVTRTTGLANTLNIRLEDNSEENQRATALALEKHFEDLGFQVSNVRSTVQEQEQISNQFGILVLFLAIMAVTLAIVGGLGLMGTMSINVLERRREIGVMRSIGASTRSIMQIVIVEGVLIGVMSWAIGAVLAYPISRVLSSAVGSGFLNSDLTFRYSTGGALLWLVTVAAIAAFASMLPARSAAQLTVREVLAYE